MVAALGALATLGSPGAGGAAPAGDDPITVALKGRCRSESGVVLLVSPRRPTVREPLQVLVVSERPVVGAALAGKGPEGRLDLKPLARGGPPYWWYARIERPRSGSYRFVLLDAAGKTAGCGGTLVRGKGFRSGAKPNDEAWWKTGRPWTRVRENIYAAWIEKLFDAPLDQRPTWSPLHAVLHDPARNFLYNYHGANEDGPKRAAAVVVKPDCADLPYFLRAYFAWKLRLPFGYRQCSRGNAKRPPRCSELRSNLAAPDTSRESLAARFSYYLRRRVGYVHSGSGATAAQNDETDLYPLALTRAAIRPGTTYIDTAGHLMVIARWVPQRGNTSGQLFVVESQPDLTVGRKRFWRGAMLFTPRPRGRAGGFKAFRPLALSEGKVVALSNKEIRKSKEYSDYSDEQYRISKDDFYERVDRLINPKPLSPQSAYRAQLDALYELIQKRKDSVATGEAYMKKSGYRVMKMARGPRIFQTTGPWEDYATPSRDFRLLVAIDQVLGFPGRVIKHPDRFALKAGDKPAAVARRLEALRKRLAAGRRFSYTRSDGSEQTLTMAQLIARRKALETAYNPNDCIEQRWLAQGAELATCKRHAPAEQRRRMEQYRGWFAARTRPPVH
jgi:hypothetical protein